MGGRGGGGGGCQMQGVIFVIMAPVLCYVMLYSVYGKLINNKVSPQNEIITNFSICIVFQIVSHIFCIYPVCKSFCF